MLRRSRRAVPTYSELFFNCIESSESTEVILCMDGDVTPEEDPKPYLDQVMLVELYISALDKTWQRLNEYFPGYTITHLR